MREGEVLAWFNSSDCKLGSQLTTLGMGKVWGWCVLTLSGGSWKKNCLKYALKLVEVQILSRILENSKLKYFCRVRIHYHKWTHLCESHHGFLEETASQSVTHHIFQGGRAFELQERERSNLGLFREDGRYFHTTWVHQSALSGGYGEDEINVSCTVFFLFSHLNAHWIKSNFQNN